MASWKAALKMTLDNAGVVTGLKAHEKAAAGADTATKKASASLSGMTGKLREAASAGNAVTGASNRWTEFASKIQIAGVAMKGVRGAAAGLKSVIGGEISFENIVRGLSTTTEKSETLREELTNLIETAKLPGLGYREAIQGAAALKTMGINAAEARDTLTAFGNALANAGRGKADLDAVVMALQQMKSSESVDMENLKEIARRVPGFLQMTAGLDKKEPLAFIRGAVAQLKLLPKAAESSQDAIDNLKDAVDQKRLGLTGGKAAGITGTIAGQVGNWLSGNGFDAKEVLNAGAEGDVIAKYSPSAAEISRREDTQKAAVEQARIAAESAAEAVLDAMGQELDMELDLQRAKEKGNEAEIRRVEEEQFLTRNVVRLARELGVEEFQVTEQLKAQLAVKRIIVDEAKKVAGEQAAKDAAPGEEVARLRSRGMDRHADKLEEKTTRAAREKELTDGGMPEWQAGAKARTEAYQRQDLNHLQKTGRRKIRAEEQRDFKQGLDNYSFEQSSTTGFTPSLLDLNPKGGVDKLKSSQNSPLAGNNRLADRMAGMATGPARAQKAASVGNGVEIGLIVQAKKQLAEQQETNRVLKSIEQKGGLKK